MRRSAGVVVLMKRLSLAGLFQHKLGMIDTSRLPRYFTKQ
jgi:hypothetical protein